MKQKENKNVEDIRAKRTRLKELSKQLVASRDAGEYMGNEDDTVNGLLRFYYACKGYKNLRTFKEWKKDGYSVKKGEKALLVWGSPMTHKKKADEREDIQQTDEEEKEDDYFPICYLFAEIQVYKR